MNASEKVTLEPFKNQGKTQGGHDYLLGAVSRTISLIQDAQDGILQSEVFLKGAVKMLGDGITPCESPYIEQVKDYCGCTLCESDYQNANNSRAFYIARGIQCALFEQVEVIEKAKEVIDRILCDIVGDDVPYASHPGLTVLLRDEAEDGLY